MNKDTSGPHKSTKQQTLRYASLTSINFWASASRLSTAVARMSTKLPNVESAVIKYNMPDQPV